MLDFLYAHSYWARPKLNKLNNKEQINYNAKKDEWHISKQVRKQN